MTITSVIASLQAAPSARPGQGGNRAACAEVVFLIISIATIISTTAPHSEMRTRPCYDPLAVPSEAVSLS